MARPREFDADTALRDVMFAFWANGYEGTSVDDLCAASGLSKSSLYSVLGDKHSLLLRSLDHYIKTRIANIRSALSESGSIRDALAALIAEIIDDVIAGPGRRGCFIGNCAAEIPRNDRKATSLVRRGMAAMEEVFHEALTRARALGEVPAETDIEAVSRFLVAGFQGLRLVGKANPDQKTLQDIGTVMLRCVS